ncbi:MAG: hypothetical protein KKH02_06940 [Proteobacteria bacterium]|nr:hypothetical protein [Pseudomonadota bacterium]MBU4582127.1 hypothetical protein [Pseudomonadota bacterium]MCG2739437.1 hypothetical protein [Syntrophaceae bacterium]
MGKVGKAAGFLIAMVLLVVLFVVPTMIVAKTWLVWSVFWGYVEGLENLTGINHYILTALALIMLVPYYIGTDMLFSFRGLVSQRRRYTGAAILLVMAVGYNLSLYYVTKEMAFAFSGGAVQKWYAVTPEGVKYYNRPGFDTTYGIPVQPVTPEVIPKLKLLEKGEFKPIDPAQKPLFNPITGQPQVWYYKYPEGWFEFYDKPGFHPVTGTLLKPVTEQVYFEWRKTQKVKTPEGVVREPQRVKPPEDVVKEPRSDTKPPYVDPPVTTTAVVQPRSGIYPVGREFKEMTGIGTGIVHLYNIEIIDGRLLRFSFDFSWEIPSWNSNPVDVYLDNPVDTTFLLDRLGRQHPLVQTAEISAERPMGVSPRSSKRFTMTFSFPSDMESFKYQAILLVKIKDLLGTGMGSIMSDQFRLHIRAEKEIKLTDFR